MKRTKKHLLCLMLALIMVIALIPVTAPFATAKDADIELHYDDRLPISELGGSASSTVNFASQTVTSKKVGTSVEDTAVLTFDKNSGMLIATATGSVTVNVDGTPHTVKVTAAPISLFMIIGHSIGAGQTGNGAQSVICEDGQAYSTHGTSLANASATGVGIGYGAYSRPSGIDAFTESGSGTIGGGSAFAYRWNQLTGEKVWVLNTAVGGTSLVKWTKGTACYNNAVAVFNYAQQVLKNEIAAGHFELQNMGLINHSSANWGYSDNGSWNDTDGKAWYESMLDGFKTDLAMDMDGDGVNETLDGIGMVPIWTTSSKYQYGNDIPAVFAMSAIDKYENVFMASLATRTWMRDIATFPDINYKTQSTPVTKPTTVAGCLASDNVHLTQVAYNAAGMDIAENFYEYLRGSKSTQSVQFFNKSGSAVTGTQVMDIGQTLALVPEVAPINIGDLTFTTTGSISMDWPCVITGTKNGIGTLTVTDGGQEVAKMTFHVGKVIELPENWNETYHCVCGDPNSTGNPCAKDGHKPQTWKPWTETDTAPYLDGYWYLTDNLDLTSASHTYEAASGGSGGLSTATAMIGWAKGTAGEKVNGDVAVYVDLNGYTITGRSGHRLFQLDGNGDYKRSLTISDMYGGGKLLAKSTNTNTNRGMGVWLNNANCTLNVYGGTLDASASTVYAASGNAQGGNILNELGTVNVYDGTLLGGNVKAAGISQGGNIYSTGPVNIYGGRVQGGVAGTTTGNTAQGGNIWCSGTLTMYGGTVEGGNAVAIGGGQGGSMFLLTNPSYIYGGTVQYGTVSKGSGINGHYGACLFVYNNTVTLDGGTILAEKDIAAAYRGAGVYVNNNATAKFVMKDGLVAAGKVNDFGAAIGTVGSGTVEIKGGVITGTYYANGQPVTDPADAHASGVSKMRVVGMVGTWTGTVNISGGTIIAGEAVGSGGGALTVYGGAKVNISGGLITGGKTSCSGLYGGSNIGVYSNGSQLTITGGSITNGIGHGGGIYVRNGGSVIISGNPVISGNTLSNGQPCNLYLSDMTDQGSVTKPVYVTIGDGGMGENAIVGISMNKPGVFTSAATDKKNMAAFRPDGVYYVDQTDDGKLTLTPGRIVQCSGAKVDAPATDINNKKVYVGETLTYSVSFNNPSSGKTSVTIVNNIPENTTYVQNSADNGGVYSNGKITWTLDVEPGTTATVSFKVTVNNVDKANISNSATITENGNPYTTNKIECYTAKPVVTQDVFKADAPNQSIAGKQVYEGDTLLYVVTYKNNDTNQAASVTITDTVPANATYVQGSASNGGTYKDGVITWKLDVAAGKEVTVSFKVTVGKMVNATIANIAKVTEDGHSFETNAVSNTISKAEQTAKPITPSTGDDTALLPLTVLAIFAGSMMIVLLALDRRRKYNRN